jgi:ArsR family metal-binding transcriptional regulator
MRRQYWYEIYVKLPHKDCGECGVKDCESFAKALLKGKKAVSDCPYIKEEQMEAVSLILDEFSNL